MILGDFLGYFVTEFIEPELEDFTWLQVPPF